MRLTTSIIVLIACSAFLFSGTVLGDESIDSLQPQRLRCEYRTNPLGVDKQQPELSWIVSSDTRGQVQSAYRILVASTPELLEQNVGDLWDTQKVSSKSTYGILYEGRKLQSHQQCFWKVRVWDGKDRSSQWSSSSHWSMGILSPDQWQGEWIGYDAKRHLNSDPPAAPLHGARWICHSVDAGGDAPAAKRIFLGVWDLPKSFKPDSATLAFCSDDVATVLINGVEVAWTADTFQPVVEEVATYLRPGRNTVRVRCTNIEQGWTGICLKLSVESLNQDRFVLTTDDRWYSLPDGKANWRTRSFEGARHAHVQGPYGISPWWLPPVRRDVTAPPSYLRGTFDVKQPVRRATAYLAALGGADVTLNGERINDDYFSSGWTDYRKRVYYRAYDVTDSVLIGKNVWGAILVDGWYAGHIAWGARRDFYGTQPRFSAMLRIEYENGEVSEVVTDRTWAVTEGPKKLADFLIGEEYDATAEVPGWDQPGASLIVLDSVDTGAEVAPEIQWHPGPPVVEVAELPAKTLSEPVPGVYVFDLGQNFAGVPKIKVRGRKGQRVRIRFAERLNPNGTLYTRNLRLARCVDFYTCKGEGEETWQPRQTFHGFQFVELTGLNNKPSLDAVTGIALSSDTPLASQFECSDPNLNRLYQNVLWTQRANFIDVPTDCPQRDERLGWTGDAQVYVHTACRVTDVQPFFRKWLIDLDDAQRRDGQFPRVAPVIPGEEDGGPAWADAGVICPWEIYQAYGDRSLLERQYPSMVRFVEFCRARSRDEVLPPDSFHAFGDWLSVRADTPREIIYTAYYARSVDLLHRSAKVLGKQEDAELYASLFSRIKKAFVQSYVQSDGRIHGDTQCAYVLAIAYGLVEGDLREKAAAHLVKDIEGRGWKLSTGFVGTKDLMLALNDINRNDVALRLLHQPEYPGWMFSISQGATSIWERWDGWTPERGFQDPGMNSFAHYSFGAVYGWMVENLGGIRSTEPGFGRLVIQPTFDPALEHCRVVYDSIRGPIETEWNVLETGRKYRLRVPANVSATLRLSGIRLDSILLDGKSLGESGLNAKEEAREDGSSDAVISIPSGEYVFTLPRLAD